MEYVGLGARSFLPSFLFQLLRLPALCAVQDWTLVAAHGTCLPALFFFRCKCHVDSFTPLYLIPYIFLCVSAYVRLKKSDVTYYIFILSLIPQKHILSYCLLILSSSSLPGLLLSYICLVCK